MSATDELRRLLDERGVEWTEGIARPELTQVCVDGKVVKFHPWQPNTLKVSLFNITPEQAVAATLGSFSCTNGCTNGERTETCRNSAPSYLDFLCSECGFVHYHSDANDTGAGNEWRYCPNCGRKVVDE